MSLEKRKENYDLLRIISMIAIVLLHTSVLWVNQYPKLKGVLSNEIVPQALFACIFCALTRFAVPCFIMLSGAFNLDNEKNSDYHMFYSKTAKKIWIHLFIFTIIYIIYRIPFCFIGDVKDFSALNSIFISIIRGIPFNHLWYLYMMLGIYLVTPILIRWKNSVKINTFRIVSIVYFIIACMSGWTENTPFFYYSVGYVAKFIGYYLIGCVIKDICLEVSSSRDKKVTSFLCIFTSTFLLVMSGILVYKVCVVQGIEESDLNLQIYSPTSPIIVLASVLLFVGISWMPRLHIHGCLSKLIPISFYIYLVHGGILDLIYKSIIFSRGGMAFLSSGFKNDNSYSFYYCFRAFNYGEHNLQKAV